ncbi:hypothetical protein NDU88_006159 [Pleurodeles waltl]|uniref:Uncharacterized protein n=1 Tax=Pleurodeles waltl TaxID=8319 RepID=A0AAV7WDW6_PLEWA|nr:hypothetical protein NDU88_006159 [Pleurodeles waltl]
MASGDEGAWARTESWRVTEHRSRRRRTAVRKIPANKEGEDAQRPGMFRRRQEERSYSSSAVVKKRLTDASTLRSRGIRQGLASPSPRRRQREQKWLPWRGVDEETFVKREHALLQRLSHVRGNKEQKKPQDVANKEVMSHDGRQEWRWYQGQAILIGWFQILACRVIYSRNVDSGLHDR